MPLGYLWDMFGLSSARLEPILSIFYANEPWPSNQHGRLNPNPDDVT